MTSETEPALPFASVAELAARAELRETHISLVYLTADRAYKFKKPVRFPFLDYTTVERRRHFCEEEVRLNRRLAPSVYLGVVEIGGEPAVEMVRLPEERMLDRLLDAGEVTACHVDAIAEVLARFHTTAPRADPYGAPGAIRRKVMANLEDARPHLPAAWHRLLVETQEELLGRHREYFEDAVAHGRIRDGHGDLHAANICLRDDEVVIFDCIEFREDFRCEDVAAEIAFLTMDMKHRGAAGLARRLLAQYLVRGLAGVELVRLLPFYECHRASIRGFVEAERGNADIARDYFRLAVAECLPPQVILTCGLPASGKSHLARRLARALGAVWLRSDVVRKELAGMAPTEHWEGGIDAGPYDPAFTEKTYAELRRRTRWHRNGGRHVVVDATFSTRAQRAGFAEFDPLVVHVTCPDDVALQRLAARVEDEREVSDAGVTYYEEAKKRFEPPADPAFQHDGSGPAESLLDQVVDRLIG